MAPLFLAPVLLGHIGGVKVKIKELELGKVTGIKKIKTGAPSGGWGILDRPQIEVGAKQA